ncbi:MAG: hypothetical protein JXR76_24925 [Deltaproteobacteria bacterium]|nr:hypothetical protein [Deltaproteobacteria bacterium]
MRTICCCALLCAIVLLNTNCSNPKPSIIAEQKNNQIPPDGDFEINDEMAFITPNGVEFVRKYVPEPILNKATFRIYNKKTDKHEVCKLKSGFYFVKEESDGTHTAGISLQGTLEETDEYFVRCVGEVVFPWKEKRTMPFTWRIKDEFLTTYKNKAIQSSRKNTSVVIEKVSLKNRGDVEVIYPVPAHRDPASRSLVGNIAVASVSSEIKRIEDLSIRAQGRLTMLDHAATAILVDFSIGQMK